MPMYEGQTAQKQQACTTSGSYTAWPMEPYVWNTDEAHLKVDTNSFILYTCSQVSVTAAV